MTTRLLVPLALGLALLHPSVAGACDCGGPPALASDLERSEVVAVVRVVAPLSGAGESASSQVEVERSWRGARAGEVLTLAGTVSDCDYRPQLKAGSKHLLYLHRSAGRLGATGGGCGRSTTLASAGDDIRELDLMTAAREAHVAAGETTSPVSPADPSPAVPWARWLVVAVGVVMAGALALWKIHRDRSLT